MFKSAYWKWFQTSLAAAVLLAIPAYAASTLLPGSGPGSIAAALGNDDPSAMFSAW